MVKRLLLLPALLTCCLFAAEYVVIVSPDAIPAEKTAGRELRKFLARLSGKEAVIASPGKEPQSAYRFHVGQTAEIKKALNIEDFKSFKADEIRLLRKGNNFYFTGDRPRGTLYAVHTFLEDLCGMRFYAPDETCYPEKFTIPGKVDLAYAPCFSIRETSFAPLRLDDEFSARRKVNGHWQKTGEAWAVTKPSGSFVTHSIFCLTRKNTAKVIRNIIPRSTGCAVRSAISCVSRTKICAGS